MAALSVPRDPLGGPNPHFENLLYAFSVTEIILIMG